MSKEWSNLAKVVTKRTYARTDKGSTEGWLSPSDNSIVERVIGGNVRGFNVSEEEINQLRFLAGERKAFPGGRGLWMSGAPAHERIGGAALNNCWALTAEQWRNFVHAMDLLMLGGGVGMSVEHRFVSKLPRIKKGVVIEHKDTKDADFIVPDSREGWCELVSRTLESYFETGKSFTYSTVCVRGYGERIKGFGGTASGPLPLIEFIKVVSRILGARESKHIRPVDAADITCAVGAMVKAGNVRRSAIIILGDPWDKEYLVMKRWDLSTLPSWRSNANFSVVCEEIEDLHPLFWKTYEHGEPYGLINRKNIQTYGRMGEKKKDTAYLVNPCAEATLEPFEPCNLQEIALCNLAGIEEFVLAAKLMHRYGKRVTCAKYHIPETQKVIERNRRVGTSLTGFLNSPLCRPEILDIAYKAIQEENVAYSKELGIPVSIRTTLNKPSGTVSKVMDCDDFEGIKARDSRYMIQRIRFEANDPLIPLLRAAGHRMEPEIKLDGSLDHGTLVVDFYLAYDGDGPIKDEGFDTWKQLDTLLMAQKWWADQAVSTTVYYKRSEIPQLKEWLSKNLKYLKTISFLVEEDHGFKQSPKEAITREQYESLSKNIKPIPFDEIENVGDIQVDGCEGGYCPVK